MQDKINFFHQQQDVIRNKVGKYKKLEKNIIICQPNHFINTTCIDISIVPIMSNSNDEKFQRTNIQEILYNLSYGHPWIISKNTYFISKLHYLNPFLKTTFYPYNYFTPFPYPSTYDNHFSKLTLYIVIVCGFLLLYSIW